jgi:hypothetical protein
MSDERFVLLRIGKRANPFLEGYNGKILPAFQRKQWQ